MKLNVTANLQFKRGKVFMKGMYGPNNLPKELVAEMKSGSRHISEVDVPNIKKPATAAQKKAAAQKRKVAAEKKKKAATEKAAAGNKTETPGNRPKPTPTPPSPKKKK